MIRDLKASADHQELALIIKVVDQGSVKAVADAIREFDMGEGATRPVLVQTGVGDISESDIALAVASKAVVLAFNVKVSPAAAAAADREDVEFHLYNAISGLAEAIKGALSELLHRVVKVEKLLGRAEVRQTYRVAKFGLVADCRVASGLIQRTADARLIRDSVVVWTGKLSGLRRFKDDAREVTEGLECGISLENYEDVKAGDVIESFLIEEISPRT